MFVALIVLDRWLLEQRKPCLQAGRPTVCAFHLLSVLFAYCPSFLPTVCPFCLLSVLFTYCVSFSPTVCSFRQLSAVFAYCLSFCLTGPSHFYRSCVHPAPRGRGTISGLGYGWRENDIRMLPSEVAGAKKVDITAPVWVLGITFFGGDKMI